MYGLSTNVTADSNEYSILAIDESPPNNDAKHIQIDNDDPKIKRTNNKTQAKTIRYIGCIDISQK